MKRELRTARFQAPDVRDATIGGQNGMFKMADWWTVATILPVS